MAYNGDGANKYHHSSMDGGDPTGPSTDSTAKVASAPPPMHISVAQPTPIQPHTPYSPPIEPVHATPPPGYAAGYPSQQPVFSGAPIAGYPQPGYPVNNPSYGYQAGMPVAYPGGGYTAGMIPGSATVTVGGPMVTVYTTDPSPQLGHQSALIVCPHCGQQVSTNVTLEAGCFAMSVAAILCFFAGPCCAFIPCCVPTCQDAKHSCPACQRLVGVVPGHI